MQRQNATVRRRVQPGRDPLLADRTHLPGAGGLRLAEDGGTQPHDPSALRQPLRPYGDAPLVLPASGTARDTRQRGNDHLRGQRAEVGAPCLQVGQTAQAHDAPLRVHVSRALAAGDVLPAPAPAGVPEPDHWRQRSRRSPTVHGGARY